MPSRKIFAGVDAGNICGISFWSKSEKKFLSVESCSFWDCIEKLSAAKDFYKPINDYELVVVIEDVTKNPVVFKVAGTYKKTKGNHQSKIAAVAEQAKRVGTVWDKTNLIIQWCERNNINLKKVRPTKKSFTKLKADSFRNLTKWQGNTNEHARDSAMIVFGL